MHSNPVPSPTSTLTLATCNLLNLALPGRVFYANQDPFSATEYQRKTQWIGERLRALNADVIGFQEVWDEAALRTAVAASGLRYPTVLALGAENAGPPPGQGGAQGTPRLGLATRLTLESAQAEADFPEGLAVEVPGLGLHSRFERPPLHVVLSTKAGLRVQVMVVHLKSKRPKFLQDEQGRPAEDRDDPKVAAVATLRSLILRGAECTALRHRVVEVLHRSREPLIVMGDFNDAPHSVTTQLVAATSEVAYDRQARDVALFNAYEIQGEAALKKDVAFSHIHQGSPEVLDQILVSEEFHPESRFGLGDVRRVDYFNDHLFEGRDRTRSDHGFVRAVLRIRGDRREE